MAAEDDLARLDTPDPQEPFTLSTGLELRLVPMQTRQVLRMLRILTHGAGPALMSSQIDFTADPEEFAGRLFALAALAIPDAESQTIEFIASMVEPAHLVKPSGAKKLNNADRDANQALWDQLNTGLFNPDPLDTLDLVERIIVAVAPELQALGKRIQTLMERVRKLGDTGAKPVTAPSPQELSERGPVRDQPAAEAYQVSPGQVTPAASPESSPPPTTTSPPSTAGQTSTLADSVFTGSSRSDPPSVSAAPPGIAQSDG